MNKVFQNNYIKIALIFAVIALILTAALIPTAPAFAAAPDIDEGGDGTTYTVTFLGGGGTLVSGSTSVTVTSGTSWTSVSKPTYSRTGYTFAGWSGAPTSVLSNVTVTATWTISTPTYQVTFDLNGGTRTGGGALIQYTTGSGVVPPTVTRAGYTFTGWSGSYTNVTSSRTITATWEVYTPPTYTVTFDLSGGTRTGGGALTQTITSGGSATAPTVTRTGYIFAGWSGTYTNITSNRTITATWEEDLVTVTFDLKTGTLVSGSATVSITRGSKWSDVPKPTVEKDGYYFAGWRDSEGNLISIDAIISANMTANASYGIMTYTINFNSNGGSSVSSYQDTEIPYLPAPTKTGYIFIGWFFDSALTNEAHVGDSLSANVTLYAKWQEDLVTVTFNLNNGTLVSGSATVTITRGSKWSDVAKPTAEKDGYYFNGWRDSEGNLLGPDTIVSANMTANASWGLTTYRIDFNSNGGSYISSYQDTEIPYLPTPTKTGYIFVGWFYDGALTSPAAVGDSLTSDITLYAKWQEDLVTVTFDLKTGTLVSGSITVTITRGSKWSAVSKPTVEKAGYYFNGWRDSEGNLLSLDSVVSANMTANASWGLTTYRIDFNSNGGSPVSSYQDTEIPYLPTPTKTGYIFVGWFYDGALTNSASVGDPLTSDITLYAKWQEDLITITFDLKTGTLVSGSVTVTITRGSKWSDVSKPIVEKAGYYFSGWRDEGELIGIDTVINANMTVNASWGLTTYRIDFNSNSGSYISSYQDTEIPYLPTPTKAGYIFAGWFYDSALTNPATVGDSLTSDVTLYASWQQSDSGAEYCVISFVIKTPAVMSQDNKDLTETWKTVNIYKDTRPVIEEFPAKPNAAFLGWSTDGQTILNELPLAAADTTFYAVFDYDLVTVSIVDTVTNATVFEDRLPKGAYIANIVQNYMVKSGYEYLGVGLSSTDTLEYLTASEVVTEDQTYYLFFKEVNFGGEVGEWFDNVIGQIPAWGKITIGGVLGLTVIILIAALGGKRKKHYGKK